MISAKNLRKNFGTLKAVRDISFEVKKGEVLGFLGPNGAGKTTTMKLLTGFLVPTSGSVSICGFDISKNLLNAQQKIGYLPEGSPLYGEMTPRTFLNFISQIRRLTNDTAENAFKKVVKNVGLEGVLDQEVETLSKGYQRRLGPVIHILVPFNTHSSPSCTARVFKPDGSEPAPASERQKAPLAYSPEQSFGM